MLPYGPLVLGDDGAYYGTTYGGGDGACPGSSVGCGTVFRVTPSGVITIIYVFSKVTSDGSTSYSDGYNPTPHLIKGSDGNFYGQTESGGLTLTASTGTIFRLTPNGVKTILFKFANLQEGPSYPDGGLVQAADGAFYGVTNYNGGFGSVGGRLGAGTVFKMTIP